MVANRISQTSTNRNCRSPANQLATLQQCELPSDFASEQALVGCCMVDPGLTDSIGISPREFHQVAYQILFETIRELVRRGEARSGESVDISLLNRDLQNATANDESAWDILGGAAGLGELLAGPYSPRNAQRFADRVREMADRRRLFRTSIQMAEAIRDNLPMDALPSIEDLQPLRTQSVTTDVVTVLDVVLHEIEHQIQRPVFQCGFDLEIAPGQAIVLGGATGTGKSTFLTQCVFEAVERTPDLVALIASVEMPDRDLIDKQISRLSGIPMNSIRDRRVDPGENLDAAACRLRSLRGRIKFLSPPWTMSRVEQAVRDSGAQLVLIDYLQKFKPDENWQGDKRSQVCEVMTRIQDNLCRQDVAVLAASSLNREFTKKENHKPHPGIYSESTEIEHSGADCYYLDPGDGRHYTMHHLKCRYGHKRGFELEFRGWKAEFAPTLDGPEVEDAEV